LLPPYPPHVASLSLHDALPISKDRFIVSMISFEQLLFTSSLCVAVSATGNPAGTWFIYAFPISPFFSLLDFPRAVIGADGLFYVDRKSTRLNSSHVSISYAVFC